MDFGVHSGVGSATVGTFTPTGAFEVEAACIGGGYLTVSVVASNMRGSSQQPCDGKQQPADYPSSCRLPTTLAVSGGPGLRWTVEVLIDTGPIPRGELCPSPASLPPS
jgi:hypothetical protein